MVSALIEVIFVEKDFVLEKNFNFFMLTFCCLCHKVTIRTKIRVRKVKKLYHYALVKKFI